MKTLWIRPTISLLRSAPGFYPPPPHLKATFQRSLDQQRPFHFTIANWCQIIIKISTESSLEKKLISSKKIKLNAFFFPTPSMFSPPERGAVLLVTLGAFRAPLTFTFKSRDQANLFLALCSVGLFHVPVLSIFDQWQKSLYLCDVGRIYEGNGSSNYRDTNKKG